MCVYVTQKGPGKKQEGISLKEKQRKGQRYGREGDKSASEREEKRRAAGVKSPSGQDLSRVIPQLTTAQGSLPIPAAPGAGSPR